MVGVIALLSGCSTAALTSTPSTTATSVVKTEATQTAKVLLLVSNLFNMAITMGVKMRLRINGNHQK